MNDLQAIALINEHARSFARPLQIGAVFAMIAIAVAVYFATLFGQLALMDGHASPYLSCLAAAGAASVVPKSVNWFIRKSLERRRTQWIDELARTEGVSKAELEDCFTLDAW